MSDPAVNAASLKIIGVSPVAYMLMLLVFPASLIALYLGQKHIHKRSLLSLHSSAKKIRWSRGLQAFCITWLVLGTLKVIMHFSGLSPIRLNFDAERFAIYALVSIIFIPMQAGTEEIVFRGYLNQGFSHILKNKWIAFIITSVHYEGSVLPVPSLFMSTPNTVIDMPTTVFAMGIIAAILYKTRKPLDMAFA